MKKFPFSSISHSKIKLMEQSPADFYLRYIAGEREEIYSKYIHKGKYIHSAISNNVYIGLSPQEKQIIFDIKKEVHFNTKETPIFCDAPMHWFRSYEKASVKLVGKCDLAEIRDEFVIYEVKSSTKTKEETIKNATDQVAFYKYVFTEMMGCEPNCWLIYIPLIDEGSVLPVMGKDWEICNMEDETREYREITENRVKYFLTELSKM